MVIDGVGQLALASYLDAKKGQVTIGKEQTGGGQNDVVDISAMAMAQAVGVDQVVGVPQLLVSEEIVRLNMVRVFMDILFGDQSTEGRKAEEGLVETVIGEPSFAALLKKASREEGSKQP